MQCEVESAGPLSGQMTYVPTLTIEGHVSATANPWAQMYANDMASLATLSETLMQGWQAGNIKQIIQDENLRKAFTAKFS